MTGKIKSLSTGRVSGFIEAESGAPFYFDASEVMSYDLANLATGNRVEFEAGAGSSPRAVNIHLQATPPPPHPGAKRKEATIRYLGFDQSQGIRTFRFERTTPGERTEAFSVNTELALFIKHKIGIQEGPGLCLRLLLVGFEAMEPEAAPKPERSLTEVHLLTFLASKPVPGSKTHKPVARPAVAAV